MTQAVLDAELVYDPSTYTVGIPYDALARLREQHGVVRVEERPLLGWRGGPGFWLVLRHADVEGVLTRAQSFSSWLGATQIRDPTTPEDLAHVRRMMLDMDGPEHSAPAARRPTAASVPAVVRPQRPPASRGDRRATA